MRRAQKYDLSSSHQIAHPKLLKTEPLFENPRLSDPTISITPSPLLIRTSTAKKKKIYESARISPANPSCGASSMNPDSTGTCLHNSCSHEAPGEG